MCIAIYKPVGVDISDEVLKNCFDNNDDGCGFAYVNTSHTGKRKIKIKKTLDYDIFLRQYKRALKADPNSPFLIHFRIKSAGPINKENCHPFKIDNEHAFIHNGTISGVGKDKDLSDTILFNQKIFQKLEGDWVSNEAIKMLIEDMITFSKMVVLTLDGDVQIYNEGKGNWKDGAWYSNTSYKPKVKYTPQPYYKDYNHGHYAMKRCDCCNKYKAEMYMSFFCDRGDMLTYCWSCSQDLMEQGRLLASDEIDKELFEMYEYSVKDFVHKEYEYGFDYLDY